MIDCNCDNYSGNGASTCGAAGSAESGITCGSVSSVESDIARGAAGSRGVDVPSETAGSRSSGVSCGAAGLVRPENECGARGNCGFVSQEVLDVAFSRMTLSLSGFRKVFAASGDKEDASSGISVPDSLIVAAISIAFARVLGLKHGSEVFLSRDARPTGESICRIISNVLKARGVDVQYAGICSAPEAFAQSTFVPYDCFIYVSASHNPIGYNGIKAGKNGAVFGKTVADKVIKELKEIVRDVDSLSGILEKSGGLFDSSDKRQGSAVGTANISECGTASPDVELKRAALRNYDEFVRNTFSGVYSGGFPEFAERIKALNVGIVADLNGSARCESIDRTFLSSLGIKTAFINDKAGLVAHGIVPEGANLEPCRAFLEKMYAEDPSYVLGYVPDNDGDRGNLAYVGGDGKARILKAQDVFALCVYSLLSAYSGKIDEGRRAGCVPDPAGRASAVSSVSDPAGRASAVSSVSDPAGQTPPAVSCSADPVGKSSLEGNPSTDVRTKDFQHGGQKTAVVVNCCTSRRIEDIASQFGAEVFRTEVGEPNVVELSASLRRRGYFVPVLGEGSNGGNIVYPAQVRDPLNTLMCMLLLLSRGMSLEAALRKIPPYISTDAYFEDGVMHLWNIDFNSLKSRYLERFAAEWESRESGLLSRGIFDYEIIRTSSQSEEILFERRSCDAEEIRHTKRSFDRFDGNLAGSLRIHFFDKDGAVCAYIWLRPSGTEPLLRVLADVRGGGAEAGSLHDYLLDWQRAMVSRAAEAL